MINLNKKNNIPFDFDWIAYRSINSDLKHITSYKDAVKHYKEHGIIQNRNYKYIQIIKEDNLIKEKNILNKVPIDFDWLIYKQSNNDLRCINSYEDAIKHYKEHGYRENRQYNNFKESDKNELRIADIANIANINDNISNVNIPKDFNWIIYKKLNSDLNFILDENIAIKHYKEHGYRESRQYKSINTENSTEDKHEIEHEIKQEIKREDIIPKNHLPYDFNWISYKNLNKDLTHLKNKKDATEHYINHGYRENRLYKYDTIIVPKIVSTVIPKNHINYVNHINRINSNFNKYTKPIYSNPTNLQDDTYNYQLNIVDKYKNKISNNVCSNKSIYYEAKILIKGNIPNILHFVYGFNEKDNKDFELFKYIAIKSAILLNNPDIVYFHYHIEPHGKYWDDIKSYLTLNHIIPPTSIYNKPIKHYAHQSDIIRLEMLNKYGGIYLDIDTICLRSFNEFLKYDFVMGIQGDNYGLCNAVIMCKKDTPFGNLWHKSYENFDMNKWDYHSVRLPLKLTNIINITILKNNVLFYPVMDKITGILFNSNFNVNLDEYKKIITHNYCIHLWETFSILSLNSININNIYKNNTIYNIFARKYINNKISIVILTHNRHEKAILCISSVLKLLDNPENNICEIFIFDNNSEEVELLDYFAKILNDVGAGTGTCTYNKIRIHMNPENIGVSGGRDYLFKNSIGDIIISIDSDLIINNNYVITKSSKLLNDESIGMIGIAGCFLNKSKKFGNHQDIKNVVEDTVVDCITGCCQIFRRDMFNLGICIDTSYGMFWCEDNDFSLQFKKIGKKMLVINHNNSIVHEWGNSGHNYMHLLDKNWNYFINKWNILYS